MAKEYIEREALIQTLNKERIPCDADVNYFIMNAPAVDVVEVIRCGECAHGKERKIKDTVICTKYNAYKDINGFCEAGEKKV